MKADSLATCLSIPGGQDSKVTDFAQTSEWCKACSILKYFLVLTRSTGVMGPFMICLLFVFPKEAEEHSPKRVFWALCSTRFLGGTAILESAVLKLIDKTITVPQLMSVQSPNLSSDGVQTAARI
ncbi:hypothetical protein DPEC_G00368380 [Dallia pectoralis]|nr:hypothetical protein DPEC_G00368380 [Dallia pectoralis]